MPKSKPVNTTSKKEILNYTQQSKQTLKTLALGQLKQPFFSQFPSVHYWMTKGNGIHVDCKQAFQHNEIMCQRLTDKEVH